MPIPGIPIQPFPICFGAASFGSILPLEASFELLDAYAEAGGNFLDTAHIYCVWLPGGAGASERAIGAWMSSRANRHAIIVGTKGGHPPLDNMARGRCSQRDLEQDLSESLERLATNYVDLYWLHRDDVSLPVEKIVDTLAGFVRDGRARALGVSNWTIERIARANAYAAANNLPPIVANQPDWSLAEWPAGQPLVGDMKYADDAMLRWHAATGIVMAPYSSQAHGYFGAENALWAEAGFCGVPPRGAEYDTPINRRRLTSAIAIARRRQCAPSQVALAFLMSQPFLVYPIIGTHQIAHLKEALGATHVRLTDQEVRDLREAEAPHTTQ